MTHALFPVESEALLGLLERSHGAQPTDQNQHLAVAVLETHIPAAGKRKQRMGRCHSCTLIRENLSAVLHNTPLAVLRARSLPLLPSNSIAFVFLATSRNQIQTRGLRDAPPAGFTASRSLSLSV